MLRRHVFFAGCQENFETRLLTAGEVKTRLICVPSFAKQRTVVLLNLRTLDATPLSFPDGFS